MKVLFAIAFRELRGGLKDFRLFLGCLIVGVTVIAAVGILAGRTEGGIRREAKTLLGGDIEISTTNVRATSDEDSFLRTQGKVSVTAGMRAMATYVQESTLVELKGVDAQYPLLGAVELASGKPLSQALAGGHIVIGEDLRERFQVKPGDTLVLGDSPFVISDILIKEPDHISGAFSLGPRVLASMDDLQKAGLLQPGSLIHYNYHIQFAGAVKPAAFKQELAQRFPHAPWIVKSFNESNRTVQGLVERLQLFLTLAGLSSLLIGGVGILNATESYVAAKATTIATFKSLGAKRNTVFAIYIIVLSVMTLLGILISAVLGTVLSMVLLPYLAQFFPVSPDSSSDVAPLLLASAFGVLTVFSFSIAALSRGIEVKPTLLFRGLGVSGILKLSRGKAFANALVAIALAALVIATSGDKKVAAGFIAAAAVCFALFIFAARTLRYAARHMHLPAGILRLSVANLHRPGAPLFSIMLSIGMALSVLVALLGVQSNVDRDIEESIPRSAPSLFLIDIQPDQKVPLTAFLSGKPYISDVTSQPMIRGRIAKLRGVPVEQAPISDDVKWATESDRGFTYAARPPEGTQVVEGSWWPADYRAAPLVSLDRKLAEGMGLHIGDAITLNILGQDIDANIASLREVNYMSLRMNFALIFSPGAIEHFPATGIMTLRISGQGDESAFVHELTQKFPNISAIRVRESLAQFKEIVGHISTAVHVTGAFALISGVMVLCSALAASLDRRAYDTVVFKVLGARRRDILAVFFCEWLSVAFITGLLSCALGSGGAWLILKRMNWSEFHEPYGGMVVMLLATLAFIAFIGLLVHSRAFALKANVILRNE